MPPIDYEVEYNNLARVPEHPEIFARWAREAATYREAGERDGRAELGLRYGATPRQTIDLFHPARGGRAQALVLFIHGGWWRSLDPSAFSHLARGLNAHGIAVAMAGYDLCPQVTIGTIVEEMVQACLFLWRRMHMRLLVSGHSAGGHLTACMLATEWRRHAEDAPADLAPAGYAISGVFELEPLLNTTLNQDLRLTPEDARQLSPILWSGHGRVLDAVVGGDESKEFLRQSRVMSEVWRRGGAETRFEAVPGANHFTVIAPLEDPDSAMVRRIITLTRITGAAMV